jgi:hypothetical protein
LFRKKRKWDQPAEDLVSAAVTAAAVSGMPVMNFGALPGVVLPGVTAYGAATLPSVVPVPYSLPPHIAPSVLQNAAAAAQKLSQVRYMFLIPYCFLAPRGTVDNYNLGLSECIYVKMSLLVWLFYYQAKIPDEVIAREIVINDADPSVRYKLTKRQTQEEVNP